MGTALIVAGIIGIVLGLLMVGSAIFYESGIPPFAWILPFFMSGQITNVAVEILFYALILGWIWGAVLLAVGLRIRDQSEVEPSRA